MVKNSVRRGSRSSTQVGTRYAQGKEVEMRRLHAICVAVALLLTISVSACGPTTPAQPTQAPEPTNTPEATAGSVISEPEFKDFDPNNFDRSTNIDNEWSPMQPGTQWAYEGTTVEDGESLPRRLEFTVTDLTKEIEGVRTVVAWIVDYNDGEVVEKEIAFYAQDNDGNVW